MTTRVLFTSLCRSTAFPTLRLRGFASMASEAFGKEKIVPEVVAQGPKETLKVEFGNGTKVELGNELTPRSVKDAPTTVSWAAEAGALYTLAMTDPDAPSRADPKFREWHHWLVANIPGTEVGKGDTLSEYIGSGPPEGTGLHRYVYLVFKQGGPLAVADHGRLTNRSGEGRGCFSIAKFADKHQLGSPVAGNFYLSQFDDYVPELYKQLGN